jgi:hypothetical protein
LSLSAPAAQLTSDARGAIPHDVQQLVVIDYRAMQNSSTAMELRDRVMPPELRQFDEALRKSGLNENHDVDELAFALFRTAGSADQLETVGIAQGQFAVQDILANFRKLKVKVTVVRANRIYPMGKTGMVLCFVDPSTMVFGTAGAVKQTLDVRDGNAPSMLTNGPIMEAMKAVDYESLWSILDQKGTQTMMRQILGEAGSVTDFESIRKRLLTSWYGMDFQHGVKFDLTISTGDTFFIAERGHRLSQNDRLGYGKGRSFLHRHQLQFGPPHHSLRGLGFRLRQPPQVFALPEHGPLRRSLPTRIIQHHSTLQRPATAGRSSFMIKFGF